MVAVTTTCPSRPAARPPARHLALVPAGPEDEAGRARPSKRVYRRRRLAAALVVAGLALVAWAGLGAVGDALTASGRPAPGLGTLASAEVVEVAPGDTFWSIARRRQPEGDVRPLVDRLVRAHGGGVLQAGERIAVPPGS